MAVLNLHVMPLCVSEGLAHLSVICVIGNILTNLSLVGACHLVGTLHL